MGKRFRECSLDQPYLLPPSVQDWLPEGHLARFIAAVAEELDLSAIYAAYERKDGRGKAAYHPLMLTRVLLYGYATGVRSSRAIEKATYDDIAFRYLSADQHPDHDTIAAFRQEQLEALGRLFVQALQLCQRAGLVSLGLVAIDGSKIMAQASSRRSLRLNRMREQEQRLEVLVQELLQQAQAADEAEDAQWGKGQPARALPPGLERAEERLKRLREAKQALEKEAAEELARAAAEHQAAKRSSGGTVSTAERERRKKAWQRARKALAGHTRHYNFTDPDSRVMRDAANGYIFQAYNAQLAVDGATQIVVAADVTQQETDRRQLAPMAEAVQRALGSMPESVLADTGYWNYQQLQHPVFADTNLMVPPDGHRSSGKASVRADNPIVQSMREKLTGLAGRKLYLARQATVEPVFAYIKEWRRFRRFSFRGLEKVRAEWSIVCLTHNLLKLFRSRTLQTA